MKHLPLHPIDLKHFEKNWKFRSFPGDQFPQPWLHPLPPPRVFDTLCREVKANVDTFGYNLAALAKNKHKINTSYMGENVYSFILPDGQELVLGT